MYIWNFSAISFKNFSSFSTFVLNGIEMFRKQRQSTNQVSGIIANHIAGIIANQV